MNDRRYEVMGPIGTGGFGTVYRARMMGPGGFSKMVALKVAGRVGDTKEMMSRLRDEARMLGLVNHRAIVGVDTLVQLGGAWTVVMEYVDGVDLARLVKAGPIPPAVALEIIGEVADALHVAYNSRGPNGRRLRLIHRDVKLGNILVTAAGEVKVLDFGIASAAFEDRESEVDPVNLGSFGYLSPERLDGQEGPAGDVYGLGVVLAEMLTGARVGRTSSRLGAHITRVEGAVERVRDMVASDDLALFVKDLMGFYPEGRPSIRSVARRCAELEPQLPGGRLRDWAETVVPGLIKLRDDRAASNDPGRFTEGEVLHETAPTEVDVVLSTELDDTMDRSVTRSSQGRLVPILSVLLAAALCALAWSVLSNRSRGVEPQPAPAPVAVVEEPAAEPGVEPVVGEPSEPEPIAIDDNEAMALAEPDPEALLMAEPTPEPVQVAPEPEPEPAPPTATVTVSGDATAVVLASVDGRFDVPGDVPPGRYEVLAVFDTGEVPTGTVDLVQSARVHLECNGLFARCTVR